MEIILDITDLSRSGSGLGRDASGRVIFVPFTLPGDRVRVEVVEEEKRYAEARLVEILSPGKDRVQPKCPAFARCGGCEWQHLPYDLQWKTKSSGVLHALERVGVESGGIPWESFPAEQIWEYRNRIQLRGFQQEIGFYERRSKRLAPIEKCWIARAELNEKIAATREEGKSRPREYKVELEVFPDGSVTAEWNSGHSARGFRQVHDEQNKKLKSWVASHLPKGEMLLDLYGGRGNLSLGLADRFDILHCVDVGAPRSNPSGTPANFQFHRSPVLPWLEREEKSLSATGKPIDLILDPPREGLGSDLIPILEILKRLPVAKLLAIGCEPDPWAKSVNRFLRHGWKLQSLGALDFFPQTHHVEALAVLERE